MCRDSFYGNRLLFPPHSYIVADLLMNKLRTWANNTLAEDAFGDHILSIAVNFACLPWVWTSGPDNVHSYQECSKVERNCTRSSESTTEALKVGAKKPKP